MGAKILARLAAAGTLIATGTSVYSDMQQDKEAKAARKSAEEAAAKQGTGDLTAGEAQTSASKKMFREGLYFTSPTGLKSSGTRGRSRLMGA